MKNVYGGLHDSGLSLLKVSQGAFSMRNYSTRVFQKVMLANITSCYLIGELSQNLSYLTIYFYFLLLPATSGTD